MKMLVVSASAFGSTTGIAERIAARLRSRGIDVDAAPVESAPRVRNYDAVIVGSAIHDGAWLPSAWTFMNRNELALGTRPTWLFSVGMVDALPQVFRKWAKAEGRKVVAPFLRSMRPRGVQLFSGVVRKTQLPRVGRVLFRALGGHFGDYRDWDAIDAWADAIFEELCAIPLAA